MNQLLVVTDPKDLPVTQNQPLNHTLRQRNLIHFIHHGIKILNTKITQHRTKFILDPGAFSS
jgi:hypothetical protein